MKISEKVTKNIIIKAYNNSQFDCSNTVLVSISEKALLRWQEISNKAIELSIEYKEFSYLLINDGDCIFFNAEDDLVDTLEKHGDYLFVELEKDEEDKLNRSEQSIRDIQMKFYGDGDIQFIGWGRHTGDEFWSDTIEIDELLKEYTK